MDKSLESPWRTSSYSGSGGGECIEVGARTGVLVRDSKDRAGAVLTFSPDAWQAFLGTVR